MAKPNAPLAPELADLLRNTGDACELVTRRGTSGLTRFANNGIHQHAEVARQQRTLRVCARGRFGVATTSQAASVAECRALAARALECAPYGPPAPGGLPDSTAPNGQLENEVRATGEMQPQARVDAIRRFITAAEERGLTAAGAFSTEFHSISIANSHGVQAEASWTDAEFSATLMRQAGGSAWVERRSVDVAALGLDRAFDTLFDKAERAAQVETLPPGKYTVLLEPAAVGELLQFLAWLGFGARQFLDGTGFMVGQLGKRLTGTHVTITDDCHHPGSPGMPFDYEGAPRKRLTLIEEGIARAVAYDTTTAAEGGVTSTGHALPQPNSFGPLPVHLIMAPGTTPRDELIAQVDNGLLVTRLWYSRVVDPGRTLITGLTRDGTFRIRGGALGPRVQDFRFNESILEAFARIVALSDTLERTAQGFVPALVIEDFNFSSLSGAA